MEKDRVEDELVQVRIGWCVLPDEDASFPLTTLLTKVLETILLKHPIVACIFDIFTDTCSVGLISLYLTSEPEDESEQNIQGEVASSVMTLHSFPISSTLYLKK